jgi:hypothetical protein
VYQGKPLRLGISPGGYKRRVPSRTSCARSASIGFMQTNSLFRKPSENEGSETQQRPRFVSAKMDVPNILIFGTLQPPYREPAAEPVITPFWTDL